MTVFGYLVFPKRKKHILQHPLLPLHFTCCPRYYSLPHRTMYFHLFLYRRSPLRNMSNKTEIGSVPRKLVLFPTARLCDQIRRMTKTCNLDRCSSNCTFRKKKDIGNYVVSQVSAVYLNGFQNQLVVFLHIHYNFLHR